MFMVVDNTPKKIVNRNQSSGVDDTGGKNENCPVELRGRSPIPSYRHPDTGAIHGSKAKNKIIRKGDLSGMAPFPGEGSLRNSTRG